jgi:class 3 adenylate cyclase
MDRTLKTGEERLWALIGQRAAHGADVETVDQRIWDLFGETWAVLFTDLSGFSRQVEAFGILHFLQIIYEHKQMLEPVIAAHDGVMIKMEADSMLLLFRRPLQAVRCAVAMQHTLDTVNKTRPPETQVLLCVGIGYGPLLRIGDTDVYGQQVNAASKLGEDTAKAREILLTRAAVEAAGPLPSSCSIEPLGIQVAGSDDNYRLKY